MPSSIHSLCISFVIIRFGFFCSLQVSVFFSFLVLVFHFWLSSLLLSLRPFGLRALFCTTIFLVFQLAKRNFPVFTIFHTLRIRIIPFGSTFHKTVFAIGKSLGGLSLQCTNFPFLTSCIEDHNLHITCSIISSIATFAWESLDFSLGGCALLVVRVTLELKLSFLHVYADQLQGVLEITNPLIYTTCLHYSQSTSIKEDSPQGE